MSLDIKIYLLDMTKASLDRQHLTNLRVVERERRKQIENTAKELRQAEVALETSKRKLDASKARVQILEHELSVVKGNIAMLNEKRSHDDRLIDALNVSDNEKKIRSNKESIANTCPFRVCEEKCLWYIRYCACNLY